MWGKLLCEGTCLPLHMRWSGAGERHEKHSLRFGMTCLPFLPRALSVPQVLKATSIPKARPSSRVAKRGVAQQRETGT